MTLPRSWLMLVAALPLLAAAQTGPSASIRSATLRAVVYVEAQNCPAHPERSGSGFVLTTSSNIVTAHHVVGGCEKIRVHYNLPDGTPRIYDAKLVRVYPEGDLALLNVTGAPAVPALRLAQPPFDRNAQYAGLGYQHGQFSAGEVKVEFSAGDDRLNQVLTAQLMKELEKLRSPIDKSRRILRFIDALQPGMSGGPIIDRNGDVIGIVAGGLKAGAAPASWGWPSDWVKTLLTSTASVKMPILTSGAYYSSTELEQVAAIARLGRTLRCGEMTLLHLGTQRFAELATGADDAPRLLHLINLSRMSPDQVNNLRFDVWRHMESGATAVMPAGYPMETAGNQCRIVGEEGKFVQMVWGANAGSPQEVQSKSQVFEASVIMPRLPQMQFWSFDPQLTTTVSNGMQLVPGPQMRPNGLVFRRQGTMHPKVPQQGMSSPILHVFETLIAKSGTFLGVATVNDEVDPGLTSCLITNFTSDDCPAVRVHMDTWTHFVLATQLSTYPIN